MELPEVIERLRDVNESVSKSARLPTEAEVAAAEQRLKFRFHPDYRYFLLHASDVTYGTFEPAVVIPDAGHLDLTQIAADAWKIGVSKKLLPFCEDNGDYFCLQSDGEVVFWSGDETGDTWPDLAHWISDVWLEEENDEEDEDEDEG